MKYFGVIDLTSGFHQVEIDKDSRPYTAFITKKGLFQFKRLCMGLKGAPSHFQQQIQTVVLNGLVGNICELYIDDVIIFGQTEDAVCRA